MFGRLYVMQFNGLNGNPLLISNRVTMITFQIFFVSSIIVLQDITLISASSLGDVWHRDLGIARIR